jgi:hypothetical protein
VRTIIILLVVAAIMFLVVGCGPGQPFEIEGMNTHQSEPAAHIVTAR